VLERYIHVDAIRLEGGTKTPGRPAGDTAAGGLVVEEIRGAAALERLRAEWELLWERCPDATPFQSPEWLLPWWRHLGRGRAHGLALRLEGELAGLALFVTRSYFGLPLRRVSLLGTGVTDYLDLLLLPGARRAAAEAVLSHLGAHLSDRDFCDFQQLPPGSPLREAGPPPSLRIAVAPQGVCPVLHLPERLEGLEKALPHRIRSNARYYSRRLARAGDAVFETANRETLSTTLDALFRLHQARWNRRLLPGAFAGIRLRRFHREVAGRFLERGWLRLHALRLDGRVRGVLYCFSCRGRAYYYSGGFDPALAPFSPGTLMIARAVEDAVRDGCRSFDFLRGDERYKYLWGAADRETARLLLWRPTPFGKLAPHLHAWERETERRLVAAARHWAARR
jgi:CelD/BcsL family acetyltransferase involved in cellulose biosynthesis